MIGLFILHGISHAFLLDPPGLTPDQSPLQSYQEMRRAKAAIRKNPSNTSSFLHLANIYLERNDLSRCESTLARARKKGESSPFYFYIYGNLLRKKGELARAEKFLFKALLDSDQEHPEYFYGFCLGLIQANKFDKAAYWLQFGLKLHPSHPQILELYTYALLKVGLFDRAEAALIDLIRKVPSRTHSASYNLANLYARRGAYPECLFNLRRAVFHGFRNHHVLRLDPAFEGVREHPQFLLILNEARTNEMKWEGNHHFKKI